MADTYKVLAQANPAAATLTDAYIVPSSTQVIGSSYVVANRSATPTSFRVSVAIAGAADNNVQYLHYDTSIAGNESQSYTIGFTLQPTDRIRVYATLATLSFNIFGIETSTMTATTIVKPSDESVSNNTLQNDNDFVMSILANQTWIIEGHLFVTGSTTGDISYAFNAPSGATGWNSGVRISGTATTSTDNVALSAIEDVTDTGFRNSGTVGTSSPVHVTVNTIIVNAGNDGSIQFRWAQATTDGGNPTVVQSGSYMTFTRVA